MRNFLTLKSRQFLALLFALTGLLACQGENQQATVGAGTNPNGQNANAAGAAFAIAGHAGKCKIEFETFNPTTKICECLAPFKLKNNGNCVCPKPYQLTAQGTCVPNKSVGGGGSSGGATCTKGYVYDPASNSCTCPAPNVINDTTGICAPPPVALTITCGSGYIYDPASKTCTCPPPLVVWGSTCGPSQANATCVNGYTYDPNSRICACPAPKVVNATTGICEVQVVVGGSSSSSGGSSSSSGGSSGGSSGAPALQGPTACTAPLILDAGANETINNMTSISSAISSCHCDPATNTKCKQYTGVLPNNATLGVRVIAAGPLSSLGGAVQASIVSRGWQAQGGAYRSHGTWRLRLMQFSSLSAAEKSANHSHFHQFAQSDLSTVGPNPTLAATLPIGTFEYQIECEDDCTAPSANGPLGYPFDLYLLTP